MFGRRPLGWGNTPGVKELTQIIESNRRSMEYYLSEVQRHQSALDFANKSVKESKQTIINLETAIDKLVGIK